MKYDQPEVWVPVSEARKWRTRCFVDAVVFALVLIILWVTRSI